ncbi:MAG TPA: tyrosine-type recombinase/integrase [Tepidisphaeraceae bacterium]|jgi:integrase|nr:tyrosine-type recombinase/integrase [Tepidisphaeraceae bacterium]
MACLKKRPGNPVYYIQFYVGTKQRRLSTDTASLQLAKEKLRQFESAEARGDAASALPTKTPIADVLTAYVQHIRVARTAKSAQTDIYYLRDVFGPVCDGLKVTSRNLSAATKKRPPKPGQDRRCKAPIIEAAHFEAITTAQIATFISGRMANRGLAPKTGNRLRDTLSALFTWAMKQHGLRLPGDKNPATAVTKYKESAPDIRFLTLKQVDTQLEVLTEDVQLQSMVATLIYAGLRREELLWLTPEDLDLSSGKYGMIRIHAKTIDGQSWQPKTKRNRAVPVSSQLRLYLDKWRLKHPSGTWLFPSPDGKHWDPDNFSSDVRAANQKAKLPWGCLDFRHTFGSTLAQRGVSLYHISAMMGNSPEICRRHYAALIPEALSESVEFLVQQPTTVEPPVHSALA